MSEQRPQGGAKIPGSHLHLVVAGSFFVVVFGLVSYANNRSVKRASMLAAGKENVTGSVSLYGGPLAMNR